MRELKPHHTSTTKQGTEQILTSIVKKNGTSEEREKVTGALYPLLVALLINLMEMQYEQVQEVHFFQGSTWKSDVIFSL